MNRGIQGDVVQFSAGINYKIYLIGGKRGKCKKKNGQHTRETVYAEILTH
jgi:hypothetical protein